jgi:hypothetical protein
MYIEDGQQYKEVPKWVLAMFRLGHTWERERAPWKRRIGVVSMPCKSIAAPIVALGALIRDLERVNANNINGHFDSLCRARNGYLENSVTSDINVIDSRGGKFNFCGSVGDENITVFNSNYKEHVRRKGRLIPNPNGPCKSFITLDNASLWKLEGEPIIESKNVDTMLDIKGYQLIHGYGRSILNENLQRSYTGLLLIGDGEGRDTEYMQRIYGAKFQINEHQLSLGNLLTLHPTANEVTRIAFCNNRKIVPNGKEHYLVIADSASAFTKALSNYKFSDVLGVYSRDEPNENLVNIGNVLGELSRYYTGPKDCIPNEYLPNSITAWFLESGKSL